MKRLLIWIFFISTMHTHCYQANSGEKNTAKKTRYRYKETIVTGTDTGMIILGSFKRKNIADVLCQRWQLENWEDLTADNIPAFEVRKSIVRDIALFKDSSVVLNPGGKTMFGTWQVNVRDGAKFLTISLSDQSQRTYLIAELLSNLLIVRVPEVGDLLLNYSAPGVQHANMYNDPFHPVNNQWRIKPSAKESDSAVYARIKNCLLFFAMYFRDHIKRKAETISFEEFPEIFTWYNKGIGLPGKENLSASWIECFYNKEQALKGYSILRKLIVDYEYEWPSRAPGWTYETHSVLEQMYHTIEKMRQ